MIFSSGLASFSVNAAGITFASDTLSTSDISAVATHTVAFTTSIMSTTSSFLQITLPAAFGTTTLANVSCAGAGDYSPQVINGGRTIKCNANSNVAAGVKSIVFSGVANPGTSGSQFLTVENYDNGAYLKESTNVVVAIIGKTTMTAAVTSNLVFGVDSVASGTSINGITTNGTSSTSTIPFGSLTSGAKRMIGQELTVTTNATNGYTVTVEQNQDLLAGGGAKIDPFIDGTASTTAQSWVGPTPVLGSLNTYGHMGFTTSDTSLAGGAFGADKWKGFVGTTPAEVMYNTGPADGLAAHIGKVQVVYGVQISALQEAGDYTNTLTYICTPRF